MKGEKATIKGKKTKIKGQKSNKNKIANSK